MSRLKKQLYYYFIPYNKDQLAVSYSQLNASLICLVRSDQGK